MPRRPGDRQTPLLDRLVSSKLNYWLSFVADGVTAVFFLFLGIAANTTSWASCAAAVTIGAFSWGLLGIDVLPGAASPSRRRPVTSPSSRMTPVVSSSKPTVTTGRRVTVSGREPSWRDAMRSSPSRSILWSILLAAAALGATAAAPAAATTPDDETLCQQIKEVHRLTDAQTARIHTVFARSGVIGQGNPAITEHRMTPEQCREKIRGRGVEYANPRFETICGGRYMAPLYDPKTEAPEDARACIDQFEFPDVPCAYPVVWVKPIEAVEICAAMGKRLCDAHEWEGACAGALEPPDYDFDLVRGLPPGVAVERSRGVHNRRAASSKTWSYGPSYRSGVCATSSRKSPGCDGGGWAKCGSNTFPDGAFPECRSPLDVYDLNGNAAEHMNLPLRGDQMASRGRAYGYTEMKGSWFVFDAARAHEDWCRWRAPFWHGSRVMDERGHHNYHLGFRCCKSLAPAAGASR
jgi:formylglycine-generating enzyme required for sulfatase activity